MAGTLYVADVAPAISSAGYRARGNAIPLIRQRWRAAGYDGEAGRAALRDALTDWLRDDCGADVADCDGQVRTGAGQRRAGIGDRGVILCAVVASNQRRALCRRWMWHPEWQRQSMPPDGI